MSVPSLSSTVLLPGAVPVLDSGPVPHSASTDNSRARHLGSSTTSMSVYALPPSPVNSGINRMMTPAIRQQIYNFSSSGALPMVGKVEDVILATLKEIFQDKKNEHIAPFLTVSKACFRVLDGNGTSIPEHDQDCIRLHEEGSFGASEYRITMLDHQFSVVSAHLGLNVTEQLQSLFSEVDSLLYSFLKEKKQVINLPKIQDLTKKLNEPVIRVIPKLDSSRNIEADMIRLRSTIKFLFRTLSCYEKAALESPYLSSIKTIVSDTFNITIGNSENFDISKIGNSENLDISKIYNLVTEYVPEIEIEYDIIFAKKILQKFEGSKTSSIWSCFQFCCG